MTQASDNLLQLEGVHKHFGGLVALRDVTLHIRRGDIHGLIGPNGAGKTTLFNIITGLYQLDQGHFSFNGTRHEQCKPHQLAAAGIARTFQNIRLFANMSILENVMVGHHLRSKAGVWGALTRNAATRAEEKAIATHAQELLHRVGIRRPSQTLAKNLPYGEQRRLEIARALATDPALLALDEPAAGMNATETEQLKSLLQSIRADGITLLLIEHDVKLVMELCDRISVLNYGEKIAEGTPAEVRTNQSVISAYLGGTAA